jgi:hypothetical protein
LLISNGSIFLGGELDGGGDGYCPIVDRSGEGGEGQVVVPAEIPLAEKSMRLFPNTIIIMWDF